MSTIFPLCSVPFSPRSNQPTKTNPCPSESSMFRSLRAALMAIAVPGAAAAVFITAMSWTSYASLDDSARKTFVAKDVVADILPPPMYLIEMRLVLSQGIEQTIKPVEAKREFDRLVKEYDARVTYWSANPPYGLET